MANESLGKAKSRKNDEFYTVYDYIQKEMNAYLEYDPNVFRGKTILLPCDDPEWSNFTKYFAQNFETLGIKKLISTSYATDRKKQQYEQYHQMTLFELNFPQYDEEKSHSHGKIFTLTRDINKSGVIDIDDLEWQYLEGDGDFRSDEVCALRDEADIIVTNPPFSLFREFVAWVMEAEKKIEISVTDTGTGIPKDQQEAVIERFYKMNSFTQGTGLGLPICRSIAEKLGGSLRIDTSYTEGCRMILTLPLIYA